MMLAEFKKFLQKNFEDNRAFANSIYSKFKRDFQYQLKPMLDWAAYLKYL